jgi:GT2 family glycosyltransferase
VALRKQTGEPAAGLSGATRLAFSPYMNDQIGASIDVSIVMPSYNKGRWIRDAVRSAACQGDRVELIVVDDASTDDSPRILEQLAREFANVRLVSLGTNRGGSHCRNRGLAEARGEFVMFLDADDLLITGSVYRRLRAARALPDHDAWVFPMKTFVKRPEEPTGEWRPKPGDHLASFLSHQLDWSIMQPLWRREMLKRIGGFDESFVRLQDPEMHARALLAGARVRCMHEHEADCLYRIDVDRHEGDASPLARRHVNGAIHFYRTFFPVVPHRDRRFLSGTLLASLASLDHWRRSGRLAEAEARMLANEIAQTCRIPRHRAVMRGCILANRLLPRRVPGLNWLARRLVAR